jgi:lincosamide nucleotidyltransferase
MRRVNMVKKEQLLGRLDDIGKALEQMGGVELLLGLGSVGVETDRLDEFSDLDFFLIVKPGCKPRYMDRLDWLEGVVPD